MKLPEPFGYFFRDSLKKFALPSSGFSVGSTPPPDADELVPLFTEAQLREALAQQEAVMRMALKCLKNSNAVSFDDLHAIKALEEQLK